ncbi:MAG: alcohol dehydrogenase catalytic domain-containing protein [Solirubrobacteraceae bacterium]
MIERKQIPRPRGWIRHYGGMLSEPSGAKAAIPLTLERNAAQRGQRLAQSARDSLQQRRSPTRPKMRALIAAPRGRIEWRSVPAPPAPAPLGATVRPLAVATCDIDCGLCGGFTPLPLPLQLGHECVGEVTAIGSEVRSVQVGAKVIVPFQISCGTCPPCLAGLTGSCVSVPPLSAYGMGVLTGHFGGAIADELAVPYADAMLVPLSDGIDPIAATSVADNIADAYRNVAPHLPPLLERDPEAEVLVLGVRGTRSAFGSSAPLYTALVAKALGARKVLFAEDRPAVRTRATELGIETIPTRALRRRAPAPLVVDMSFHPRGLKLAIASTAPDGVCSCAGSLHGHGRIPLLAMYIRNSTLHLGRAHVRSAMPDVLELVADGRLKPLEVVARVASFEEAPQVLHEAFRDGAPKIVLTA